jgi:hypothetical protein
VVVATGVTADGGREILGVDIGDSEDETFWTGFLRSLKARGLAGVRLVVSDAHAGLKEAIVRVFQGASWQRCRVHYARNLLATVPRANTEMVAAAFRTIFAQLTPDEVGNRLDEVADSLAARFPKAAASMREAKSDVLAFRQFPFDHWRKIWSNNLIERLNKEIKRRTNVVGIFPTDNSALRLIGAVLAEQDDEWVIARRYLSDTSMAQLDPGRLHPFSSASSRPPPEPHQRERHQPHHVTGLCLLLPRFRHRPGRMCHMVLACGRGGQPCHPTVSVRRETAAGRPGRLSACLRRWRPVDDVRRVGTELRHRSVVVSHHDGKLVKRRGNIWGTSGAAREDPHTAAHLL